MPSLLLLAVLAAPPALAVDGPTCGPGTSSPRCVDLASDARVGRSFDPAQSARGVYASIARVNGIAQPPPFTYRADLPQVTYDCLADRVVAGASSARAHSCDGRIVGVIAGSRLYDIAANCTASNPAVLPEHVIAAALAHELGHVALGHLAEEERWYAQNCARTPDPAQPNWFAFLLSRGPDEADEGRERLAQIQALPADQRGRAALAFERELCMRYKRPQALEMIRAQERAADEYSCQSLCRLKRARALDVHPQAGPCLWRSAMDIEYLSGHDTRPESDRTHDAASSRAIAASACWARACPDAR
jgi:hypothetical protein